MNAPGLFGFITMPGGSEWIIIGVVALLIFGRRLPEVARSLGKGIVEFKKGIAEVESEVDRAGDDYGADTSTVDSSSESGTEDDYGAEGEYGADSPDETGTEDDYGADGEYGVDGSDETDQDDSDHQDEDPVDEADTYETFDSPDEAAEDAEAAEAEDDTPKAYGSADASTDAETVQEDSPGDDVDPGHRDDAHPND